MMVQYWGTANYNEFPLTGVLRLWTTGQLQDVPDAIAARLVAAGVGFQYDSSSLKGEPAIVVSDPLTGVIRLNDGSLNPQSMQRVGYRGQSLFTFSDTANWTFIFGGSGGSIVSDTTNKKASTNGLAVNTGSSSSDGVKKSFGAATFAIQSGSIIRLMLYVPYSALTGTNTLSIKFSSDNNATKGLAFTFGNAYFQNAGWQVLTAKAGEDGTQEFQSGATWTATGGEAWGANFNYCHIVLNNFNGSTITLDSLLVGAKDVPRVVFSFDGVAPSVSNAVARSLAAHGWAAGIFTDGDTVSIANDKAGALSLVNDYGWSWGTQGIAHTNYTSNGRDIGADFDTAAANMIAVGAARPTTFAYPVNQSNKVLDATLAGRGVVWRRSYGEDIINTVGYGIPNSDDGMVRSGFTQHLAANYNLGTAYQQVKNRIDRVCAVGGVLSLFTHKETALSTDWSLGGDLTQWYMLVEYLWQMRNQYGLEVVTPEQVKPLLTAQRFV
jgi:hypothetical protein